MAVIFADYEQLMQSSRLPYSAKQLPRYVRKHFPEQRVAFVYEASELCRSLRELGSIYDVNPQLALWATVMPPANAGSRKHRKRSDY
jgi:hypothetical protein